MNRTLLTALVVLAIAALLVWGALTFTAPDSGRTYGGRGSVVTPIGRAELVASLPRIPDA